jgi:hypothetical protein
MCRQRRPNSLVSQVRRQGFPSNTIPANVTHVVHTVLPPFQPFTSSHFSRMIPPQLHQTHMPIFKIVIVPGSLSASASSRPADFPISAKAKAPHSRPAVSDGACAKAAPRLRHRIIVAFAYWRALISHGKSEPQTQKWKKLVRIAERQGREIAISPTGLQVFLLFCRRPKRIDY